MCEMESVNKSEQDYWLANEFRSDAYRKQQFMTLREEDTGGWARMTTYEEWVLREGRTERRL